MGCDRCNPAYLLVLHHMGGYTLYRRMCARTMLDSDWAALFGVVWAGVIVVLSLAIAIVNQGGS